MVEVVTGPTIVLFSPGLKDEAAIWGERIVVQSQKKYLERMFPGARVLGMDSADLPRIATMRVDLLISYYTGSGPPWRVDDIADHVDGVTILMVVNHGDLLEEFSRIHVDGFITNSRRALGILGRNRPAAYIPLAVEDDFGPVRPDERYRAEVVYLGSGGHGNKRPETTRHYLDPAKGFDFHLWGSYWEREHWAGVYRDDPDANNWCRFWRGPLPLGDITGLYSSAQIVLGYHEDSQRQWGMWNNRLFEALACGAFLISDDAVGLREEFGEAIEITAGGEGTTRLITHYLARPDERRRRGELGRRLVQERYTYSRWARSVREFYERLRGGGAEISAVLGPKFTVVIPVYNRTVGLREAIESVVDQTLGDLELILADDGSTCETVVKVIEEFRAHPKVRILRLPHGGPGASINAAARTARGRYLCRLDSDDLIVPEALEVLDRYTERYPDVSYFYSSRYVIDEDGTIIEAPSHSVPFDASRLLQGYMANPLLCWKRVDFLAVGGFREDVRFAEDYDLALRMACRFTFQNVSEFLYKIRYHSEHRITTSLSEAERQALVAEVRATSGSALRDVLRVRTASGG